MGNEGKDQTNLKNLLIDPVRLLLMMSGRIPPVPLQQIDCDELTAFVLGVAFFLDLPTEIITVALDPARPDQFSHVYLHLQLVHREGGGIPFDLTASPYPGSGPSAVFRRRIWPVNAPIDPSSCPEPDRATAKTVLAMIEKGRASALHPEFHWFMKQVARWLVPVPAGMISQEEWRRSEAGQEFLRSVGASETRGDPFLCNLSGEHLQTLRVGLPDAEPNYSRRTLTFGS